MGISLTAMKDISGERTNRRISPVPCLHGVHDLHCAWHFIPSEFQWNCKNFYCECWDWSIHRLQQLTCIYTAYLHTHTHISLLQCFTPTPWQNTAQKELCSGSCALALVKLPTLTACSDSHKMFPTAQEIAMEEARQGTKAGEVSEEVTQQLRSGGAAKNLEKEWS